MYLQSLVAIFCLLMGSYPQETDEATTTDPLPEEDPNNFQDQDATQVVKLTGKYWVTTRTHKVSTPFGDPKCEYAQIVGPADGVGEETYTLELGASVGPISKRKNLTLVLKTSGSHRQPNVMEFQRNSVDGPQEHKLLYSNYGDCAIVRIKKKDDTGLYCDLLQLGSTAGSDPPSLCKEKFEDYCKGEKYEPYSADCETK
uniref:Putative salivary lipocalin n=1 Tax=Ixodes ricinus TaxID=34613 RepID=A0A0K8R8Y2_IXORI